MRTPKLKLVAEQPLTGECWIPPKKDMKSKRERERYSQLNADFQRIARRDKKAFLNEQCKEEEGNNRKGKTRDLKKVGDIKGIFHASMDTIKDRNGKDLCNRSRRD